MRVLLCFALSLFFISCQQETKKVYKSSSNSIDQLELDYATGFAVNYFENYKELLVFSLDRKDTLHRYYLSDDPREGFIKTPISRLASLSSVYAAYIEALGLEKVLLAVDENDYIHSPTIRKEMENRELLELGSLDKINHERLLMLQPELVYTFGWQDNSSNMSKKYENIHFVYAYEYQEQQPLGRAEWIRFFACFFNKEAEADSIFDEIKTNYENLKARTTNLTQRPKVLINMPFKEQWYMPGGKSYSAHLIKDAGAYYPWDTLQVMNSVPMDWELVYQKAYDSDFWINTGEFTSYAEVQKSIPDMNLFEPFQNKKAYNNNARMNGLGGNDYWESGLLYVDDLLSDLIVIFHPDLLPNKELKYYKALEDE